jgi:Caspase domain
MRGDLELRRRWGGAGAFPRRAVLAGAGSIALGLGGSAYFLWPPSLTATAKFAEPHRTALVVGNAQYQFVSPLENPVRDADTVSEALEQRGFRVIRVVNADGRQMADSISDFERTLSVVGGVGIFYYAGRAAYIDGEDVLMPVDVKLDSTQAILEGGVNLATLQAQIQAKTTRKFVSNGSVVYSASKGQEADDGPPGKHSPFTTAFLEALEYDQDELGDLFRRIGRAMDREPSNTTKKQTPYFEIRVRSDSTSTDRKAMRRSARSKFLSSIRVATIL